MGDRLGDMAQLSSAVELIKAVGGMEMASRTIDDFREGIDELCHWHDALTTSERRMAIAVFCEGESFLSYGNRRGWSESYARKVMSSTRAKLKKAIVDGLL